MPTAISRAERLDGPHSPDVQCRATGGVAHRRHSLHRSPRLGSSLELERRCCSRFLFSQKDDAITIAQHEAPTPAPVPPTPCPRAVAFDAQSSVVDRTRGDQLCADRVCVPACRLADCFDVSPNARCYAAVDDDPYTSFEQFDATNATDATVVLDFEASIGAALAVGLILFEVDEFDFNFVATRIELARTVNDASIYVEVNGSSSRVARRRQANGRRRATPRSGIRR